MVFNAPVVLKGDAAVVGYSVFIVMVMMEVQVVVVVVVRSSSQLGGRQSSCSER